MARAGAVALMRARLDMTDQTVDAHIENITFDRPVEITAVKIVPGLPLDTDTDTIAVDVSYSTDGFSSSDVEVAAHAAEEFNDTTNDLGTLYTSVDVPLTTANTNDVGTIRVPAGAVIRATLTSTGASADGFFDVVVLGHVL